MRLTRDCHIAMITAASIESAESMIDRPYLLAILLLLAILAKGRAILSSSSSSR